MRKLLQNEQGHWNAQIIAALIAAAATLLTALIAGVFGLLQLRAANAPASDAALAVEIEGPAEAPLGEQTYFTLISENAVRAEWAIAGFGRDEINPFRQADQIFVQPTDAGQVGREFTLLVTVYDADGNPASARHRFKVAPAPINVEP
jgi:hypothetical protein